MNSPEKYTDSFRKSLSRKIQKLAVKSRSASNSPLTSSPPSSTDYFDGASDGQTKVETRQYVTPVTPLTPTYTAGRASGDAPLSDLKTTASAPALHVQSPGEDRNQLPTDNTEHDSDKMAQQILDKVGELDPRWDI